MHTSWQRNQKDKRAAADCGNRSGRGVCGSVLGRQGNRCAARRTAFGSALTASARCRNWLPVIDGPFPRGKLPREAPTPASPFRCWGSLEAIPSEPPSLAHRWLASDVGGEGMAAIPLVSLSVLAPSPGRDKAALLRPNCWNLITPLRGGRNLSAASRQPARVAGSDSYVDISNFCASSALVGSTSACSRLMPARATRAATSMLWMIASISSAE